MTLFDRKPPNPVFAILQLLLGVSNGPPTHPSFYSEKHVYGGLWGVPTHKKSKKPISKTSKIFDPFLITSFLEHVNYRLMYV